MKKIITFLIVCIAVLACNTYAQSSFKWKDSTVTLTGSKVSQSTLIGTDKKPNRLHEFYYGFNKTSKTHILHLVQTNITPAGKELYIIYKYLVPAASINTAHLKIENAENDAYEAGGFLYVSLRCKEDKEDIIMTEKGSHYDDFGNETKVNEISFEAGMNDKTVLEKLIQQIKMNK